MDAIETPVLTSALTDVRNATLGRALAPAILDRLRPNKGGSAPQVAAFNSSI